MNALPRRSFARAPGRVGIIPQTQTLAAQEPDATGAATSNLFSGHMIDAPERSTPRSPADKESVAAQKIGAVLDDLAAERPILPSTGGDKWRERYFNMKQRLKDPTGIMPHELGPLPAGVDAFERCNLWLLYTTLAWGVEKARFICLGNGGGGDGPGGTEQMYNDVKKRTGQVTQVDTRKAWQ